MTEPVVEVARSTAHRLTDRYGPSLPGDVEAALLDRAARPDQYLDPVAVGGLIVSVATLAWTVYKDLTKSTPEPARHVIVRTIRLRLPAPADVSPDDRDRIIDAVVTETFDVAQREQR